jgi:hypothetical protein
MARREFSHPTRKEALHRSGKRCEAIGERYGLAGGRRCNADLSYGVEFDHAVPDGLGGDNSLSNCLAVCVKCHRWKTGNIDASQIAKMKRQKSKHEGTWPKSKARLQSRPFPSTRHGLWQPNPRSEGE